MRPLPPLPLIATAVAAVLTAGCVPRVAPPPVAPTTPPPVAAAPAPAPPLSADWRDWPRTPGEWRYDAVMGARYVDAGGRPLVTLTCDRAARRVAMVRPSPAVATSVTVRTSSTVRSVPVQARAPADAAPLVMLDAILAADDRLLDAMAFSRGTFTIEQAGQPPLVLPAWAEVGRIVQDCR